MFYKSLGFLFFDKIPDVKFFIFLIVIIHQSMKQIVVKVTCARLLKAGIELLLGSFLTDCYQGIKFL